MKNIKAAKVNLNGVEITRACRSLFLFLLTNIFAANIFELSVSWWRNFFGYNNDPFCQVTSPSISGLMYVHNCT